MDTGEFIRSLDWLDDSGQVEVNGNRLSMRAAAETDWFNDPEQGTKVSSAPAFCAAIAEDCQVSARVGVGFESVFDAGVLFVHQSENDYAKLCFERAPSGENTIVSVVTRNVSDDANGPSVADDWIHLRISSYRGVIAFHWSTDGRAWALLRYFQLRDPGAPTTLGFVAQSPTGEGCTATFSDISYRPVAPTDIRNGT